MQLSSLGYSTDLIFPRHDGQVQDRDGYLLVRTPQNPGFYWGNLLIFPAPPAAGDLERWDALFAREFEDDPGVRHRTFGWDGTSGELGRIEPFREAGYVVVDDPVMTIDAVPERPACGLELDVRPLAGDADWAAFTELNVAADERDDGGDESYALFKRRLRARSRAWVEAGLGPWLGAFAEGRLVGGLGLFVQGQLGRFQSVETHPEFRGRGVCSALVAEACRLGLTELGATRLVIVAESGGQAERIYRRVGFEVSQRQAGAFLRPTGD